MADIQMQYDNAFDSSKELFTPEMEQGGWLNAKGTQLSGTRKKGIFGGVKEDSSLFTDIKTILVGLNDLMETNFSSNDKQTTLQLAYNAYMNLIRSCDKYLTDKKGGVRTARTKVGQDRIRMVNEIRQFAEKDINGIRVQMFLPDDLRGTNLREAIGKARTKTINMQTPDSAHKHVGGNASNLTVLSEEENGGEVGFFSEQKTFDKDTTMIDAEPFIEKTIQNTRVEKIYYDKVISFIKSRGKKSVGGVYNLLLSEEWKKQEYANYPQSVEFQNELKNILYSTKTAYENIFGSGLANVESKKVGFNQRNVATSRIASILKFDKIIAKSEIVQLNDVQKGETRMGSVMNKAKGTESLSLLKKHVKDMRKATGKKVDIKDLREKIKGLMTGSFMRDMSDLQVMDYLCGQIDRHSANYFIDTNEEGKFVGVQGIDNDLSFGNAKEKEKFKDIGTHGRAVMNENDELTIPHMSRGLAISIDLINENMVRYALMDLIGKSEIEAFCYRLSRLKKAVRKELELGDKSKVLLDDTQWEKVDKNDFLKASNVSKSGGENDGTSNYVGRFYVEHLNFSINETEREIAEELKKLKQK